MLHVPPVPLPTDREGLLPYHKVFGFPVVWRLICQACSWSLLTDAHAAVHAQFSQESVEKKGLFYPSRHYSPNRCTQVAACSAYWR